VKSGRNFGGTIRIAAAQKSYRIARDKLDDFEGRNQIFWKTLENIFTGKSSGETRIADCEELKRIVCLKVG